MNDILEAQKSNGWVEETTLYHRHFSVDDQTLSRPGRLHLQRIFETAPSRRRAIYIQSTRDPNIDNVRLSNVQGAIAEITYGAETIPVSLRVAREHSRPASEVQAINALYNASIPAPRLAGAAGSGGSAAAGGGAGPAATP